MENDHKLTMKLSLMKPLLQQLHSGCFQRLLVAARRRGELGSTQVVLSSGLSVWSHLIERRLSLTSAGRSWCCGRSAMFCLADYKRHQIAHLVFVFIVKT